MLDLNFIDKIEQELGIEPTFSFSEKIYEKVNSLNLVKKIKEHRDSNLEFNHISEEHDAMLLPNINKALKLIKKSKKILVYGDFDTDGLTSGIILGQALLKIGKKVKLVLPEREDGHGLHKDILEKYLDYDLVITTDCGTNDTEVVQELKKHIDFIITDHHLPQDESNLPDCPIVNCQLSKSKYPFRELVGAGVSYKIATLLIEDKETLNDLKIWATIGTIGDVGLCQGENRLLIQENLNKLNQTKNLGLRNLLNEVGYEPFTNNKIGWNLIPTMNSMNRTSQMNILLEYFKNPSQKKLDFIVKTNTDRKELTNTLNKSLISQVNDNKDCPVNFVFANPTELGVCTKLLTGQAGLLANKLAGVNNRPTVVMIDAKISNLAQLEAEQLPDGVEITGNSIGGSARSQTIGWNDIAKKLGFEKNIFSVMGHNYACGVKLDKGSFLKIKNKIIDNYSKVKQIKLIKVDKIVTNIGLFSVKNIEELNSILWGNGYEEPTFGIKDVEVIKIENISKKTDEHKRITILLDGDEVTIMFFFGKDKLKKIEIGQKVHLVTKVNINKFAGKTNIQFIGEDISKVN